ncbi:MAG: dienelactone hydrolase family protein [Nitrospinales bacterium]
MKFFFSFLLLFTFVGTAQAEIQTKEIKYSVDGVSLKGYVAFDDAIKSKRPGVLVVHEWWGHNEHARNRAEKLASIGYTALAIDMYGDGKLADHPKKAGEFMNDAFTNWDRSTARFKKAIKILQEHKTVDTKNIGAIGFCFGGAVSVRMAIEGADLKGVVGFHSNLPVQALASKEQIKASIMIINGGDDGFIKAENIAALTKGLAEKKADFTYTQMAGVKHSYTNVKADEFRKKFDIASLEYNKQADERSWKDMKRFFKRVFKPTP